MIDPTLFRPDRGVTHAHFRPAIVRRRRPARRHRGHHRGRRAGKVFFTYNGLNYVCSASTINNSDFSHDQAFVTLQQRNGANLIDTVGGNGLVWGNGRDQANTRIWGWPAEPPYNGEVPYYCDGSTYAWGTTDAALTCSMNGGASGGPWLKDRIDANLGYVFAVTSRRTTSGTPTLLATPNSADVKTMFDEMTT